MPDGGRYVAPALTMGCIVRFGGGRGRLREVGGELIQQWSKTVSEEVALEYRRVKAAVSLPATSRGGARCGVALGRACKGDAAG